MVYCKAKVHCGSVHNRDENASKNGLVRLIGDLTADGLIGNLHVPGSGPFKPFVARRCRMAFRSGGRWKVEPQGSSASMNQIVSSEITERVGGYSPAGVIADDLICKKRVVSFEQG
jgi:hypothetical protein